MSKKKRVFSSTDVIKILTRFFDFEVVKQRGSHIKCQKIEKGRTITTIVPNHKELAKGTLLGVLELAEVELDEFLRKISTKN